MYYPRAPCPPGPPSSRRHGAPARSEAAQSPARMGRIGGASAGLERGTVGGTWHTGDTLERSQFARSRRAYRTRL